MPDYALDPGTSAADYDRRALAEMAAWRERVLRKPGLAGRAARRVQDKINEVVPEKVHAAVTAAVEQMTRAILTGADLASPSPLAHASLWEREARAREAIGVYRTTASAEGGVAGAGGFLLAAADFPVLFGIKLKLLFDIAALYGHTTALVGERLYILHIFQLAFSSIGHRREVLAEMEAWSQHPPRSLDDIDWRRFQQEYRDHIDLAKLAQLLPLIGAPVGAIVNYRLVDRLGETAINAYRMRWFEGR